MKICAYCGEQKKLTREHVIPNWYGNIDKSPDDIVYLEKAPKKLITEITVKDVCQDCNNIHLSKLDLYGKELYEKYFQGYVYKGESIEFKYDYQKLLKWLIKCSFNSARVHNADLEVLKGYADILIGNKELPKDIVVFCSLIAPSNIDIFDNPSVAGRDDNCELYEPSWFRLGVFRVPEFDSLEYCFRSVMINSYTFFIAIPKLKSDYLQQKQQLLSQLNKHDFFGVRVNQKGCMKLTPPAMEAMGSYFHHMANNSITYELDDDVIAKHVMEENTDYILFIIPREDIEEGNTKEIEDFFLSLTFSRERALLYMQKIEFSIDGYNDDPRELYEIREVVNYLGKLNKLFPYWLFFQNVNGTWLRVLLVCLSQASSERVEEKKKLVEMKSKLLGRHIDRWFSSLNELSHKFSISERLNRKISEDFNAVIKQFFPIDK